jgi:transposase
MDYHQHARLTVFSRERLARQVLEQGLTLKPAAKWVRRYREQGAAGLRDRSSRPRRLRQPTPPEFVGRVEALRRERWTGLRIAQQTGLSRATISRILRRLKLSRMRDLEPKPAVQRYEHARPGDLLHLDIKKLGRIVRPSHRVTGDRRDSVDGAGWEYVHVAIDDHSRIAFSAIYPDEKQASVLAFLAAALAYYARLGIHFKAVLTDNGPAYRSHTMAAACRARSA